MGPVIHTQSWERDAAHNGTWKSSIPHADSRSFTSSTATHRNNLPAGFITVMNDCSLVSATLGKVGHDESVSFKKSHVTAWWMLHFSSCSYLQQLWTSATCFFFIKQKTGAYCVFHMLHHICLNSMVYDSRLVQYVGEAYRGQMPRWTNMEVYSACT